MSCVPMSQVSCYLPAEASFGLADEMRRRSSGAASASLLLSHWERLQVGGEGGGEGCRRAMCTLCSRQNASLLDSNYGYCAATNGG